eukprot:5422676-Prymnesium_polylepis.2
MSLPAHARAPQPGCARPTVRSTAVRDHSATKPGITLNEISSFHFTVIITVNMLRETVRGTTATHTRGLRFVRPSGHVGSCIARRPAFLATVLAPDQR